MLICISGCAGTDQIGRAEDAARRQAASEARQQTGLPDLPLDCRKITRSGVQIGERLDTALLMTDAALAAQNARTTRCATWYDTLRERLSPNPKE